MQIKQECWVLEEKEPLDGSWWTEKCWDTWKAVLLRRLLPMKELPCRLPDVLCIPAFHSLGLLMRLSFLLI